MPWPVASPPDPGFFTNSLRRSRKGRRGQYRGSVSGRGGNGMPSGKKRGLLFARGGGFAGWARSPRGVGRARGSMLAPVVDVTQRILDERLVLVVPPLAIHDELVLVVPRRQVAHHREHAAPVGRGLGGHRHRLQPVSERPAQVDLRALAIGWVSRGRDLGVPRGFEIDDRVGRRRDCRDTRGACNTRRTGETPWTRGIPTRSAVAHAPACRRSPT